MKVKGELHVGTGGAIFVQQQLGSNRAYAKRISPSNLSPKHMPICCQIGVQASGKSWQ